MMVNCSNLVCQPQTLEKTSSGRSPESHAGSSVIVDREGPPGTEDNREEASGWAQGSAAESASFCAREGRGLKETRPPPRACPTPHLLREKKDTEQRQEFRQLILYLKNNKPPDFTY